MAPFALDIDLEAIARREQGTGPRPGGARGRLGPAVEPVDPFDRVRRDPCIEDSVLDHPGAASTALLRGLEEQDHGSIEPVLRGDPGQVPGGAQEDGGVAVVSAGMHAARDRRGPGGAGLLGDGKGVDVRPQGDRIAADRPGDPPEDAGAAGEAGRVLDADVPEFGRDHVAGPVLLVGDLGMGMEVPADLRGASNDVGGDVHRYFRRG